MSTPLAGPAGGFAVVRHTESQGLGVVTAEALDLHRANGWIRVSPWAAEPADLHLPDYVDAHDDLDAVQEEPDVEQEPERKTRKSKATPAKEGSEA